jgi:hypothetical protein
MRTTLTIDDDVAYGLRRLQENEPGTPFKRIVNDILRRGLTNGTRSGEKKRFKVKSMNLGLRKDLNFDNIEEVLDILEGPNRK